MDILNLIAASGGGLSVFALFGVLGMALTVFIAGAALALKANRSANDSRVALADAEIKLAAASDLADEVRGLRAQVEEAVVHHNQAVSNARLMHNDACAAQDFAGHDVEASKHDDDDHHKKHTLKGGGHDDDDDHHKKHQAHAGDDDHAAGLRHRKLSLSGGHDDDDHKHKKKHQAGDNAGGRQNSFMGWFFDR